MALGCLVLDIQQRLGAQFGVPRWPQGTQFWGEVPFWFFLGVPVVVSPWQGSGCCQSCPRRELHPNNPSTPLPGPWCAAGVQWLWLLGGDSPPGPVPKAHGSVG